MNCKNCTLSIQTHHNFCPHCGAKVIRKRLTIKALFSHFSEQFLNYDNKFFQTFIQLFTKPEKVIGCYINGTRKKYVNVISYFAIALTITGLEWYLLNKFFPHVIDMSAIAAKGTEVAANDGVKMIQEYASIVLMLFVPVYALMSRIVFFNIKKFNYTEHLVIFMYVIAQISIFGTLVNLIGAVFGIPLGILVYINGPFQILFSAYCLKRLYNLSLTGIFLRTLLFLVVLVVLFILSTIIYLIVMILYYGGLEEFVKAQKTAIEASGS